MQNFMKTILSAVQTWTKGKIKESTADWSQNDSSADNYVKNRTHWEEVVEKEVELLSEYTISSVEEWDEGTYGRDWEYSTGLVIGQKYTITWNGVTFTDLLCFDDDGYPTVGAPYRDYSEYHFGIYSYLYGDQNMLGFFTDSTEPSHTISVVKAKKTIVHKLDSKYLDLPTNLATTDDVSTKMDANNPVGTGSFSMNRKAGTTVGDNSHTEGYGATASGNNSHAEGSNTTASAFGSHAEGYRTAASSDYSHAEGYYTTASGYASHAEGYETTASGKYSHAEGSHTTASGLECHAEGTNSVSDGYVSHAEGYNTKSSGTAAHAEGTDTKASGEYSHAEGCCTTASDEASHAEGSHTTASGIYSHAEGYYTTASGGYGAHAEGIMTRAASNNQHVQGKYNIADTADKYAHIVGNGTSGTARSNAHTLDWNGVGWFQGGLQVGGNAQDDGAKNVLLEGDAVPIPTSATVGQTIAVKSVDENGKPVEWETTDISTSGGSGCVVGDTAPEDTSVLWIDTADNSDDTLQDAVNIALAQAKESGEFKGDPGKTPEKGVDYYTDTDKAELVNAVLSALPAWTGGSY